MTLRALVDSLEAGDEKGATSTGEELERLTPFYRSVKSVRIFYFLGSEELRNETFAFQRVVSSTFRILAGSDVSIAISCFLTGAESDERLNNSVLVIWGDAFSYELEDSVVAYVQRAFYRSRKDRESFREGFRKLLIGVRDAEALEEMEDAVGRAVERLFREVEPQDVERTEEALGLGLLENPVLRGVVDDNRMKQILIRPGTVRQALVAVTRQRMLGESKLGD